jgi:RimJ/RimL family protein N-acetyltransferase
VNETSNRFELRAFRKTDAALVARWVRDDNELFWLAPQTVPPITTEKVAAWTARYGRPMLLWTQAWADPVGYAELNDWPGRPEELWIGHFIIDPARRGKGVSRWMLRLLLDQAFGVLGAYRVALIVFPENEPAVRCYRSGGLVEVGTQQKTFPSRPGSHMMIEMAIDRPGYESLPRGGADGRLD